MSVLVVPQTASGPLALERYGWLPIAAGVAMTDTVAEVLPEASTGFKWPNDVLINGRKVCGVLAEILPDRGGVVIGAGVNVGMTVEQLPVDTATSLAIEGAEPDLADPDTVLAGYLARLRGLVEEYLAAGGDAEASGLAALARSHCITLGRGVRVELPDGSVIEGRAVSLDADGRLIVRRADGRDDDRGRGRRDARAGGPGGTGGMSARARARSSPRRSWRGCAPTPGRCSGRVSRSWRSPVRPRSSRGASATTG